MPGQSKGIDLLLKNLLGSSDAGRDWEDDDAMRRDGHLATNSQAHTLEAFLYWPKMLARRLLCKARLAGFWVFKLGEME